MGPVRGLKKRKKVEKKVDQNVLAASLGPEPEPLDWWDGFSQRITGKDFFSFFLSAAFFFCFACLLVCYVELL